MKGPLQNLPIDSYKVKILKDFANHENLILTAEPGAGKTTRLPWWIAQSTKGKVIVLEPRRLAAAAAADRIAQENNLALGEEVGYQVRFENKTGPQTQLIFLTEKLLTKKIIEDPELQGVDVVIFDEFHERSIDTDFALAHLRELQLLGHRIKIVIMSATLVVEKLKEFLGDSAHVAVPGSLFPIQEKHSKTPQALRTDETFLNTMVESVLEGIRWGQKSILVFLPGVGEIARLSEKLSQRQNSQSAQGAELKKFLIQQLHGSLKLSEQKAVLSPGQGRRIILTTNIAESALTVDGVDTVIDSGLERSFEYDLELGFGSLSLKRISLFSAKQRAGRSARQFPGVVIKAWTHLDERSMRVEAPSALQTEDLSEIFMTLSKLGVLKWQNFTWFESPGEKKIMTYSQRLQALGVIDSEQRLSELGSAIVGWPVDLRSANLLFQSQKQNVLSLGILAAAILQDRDRLKPEHAPAGEDCDLLYRIELFLELRQRSGSDFRVLQTERICFQLAKHFNYSGDLFRNAQRELLDQDNNQNRGSSSPRKEEQARDQKVSIGMDETPRGRFKLAVLLASLDQLCQRRPKTSKGVRVDRKGVQLNASSCCAESDYFVVLSAMHVATQSDLQVELASGFDLKFVKQHLAARLIRRESLVVDESSHKMFIEEKEFFLDLEIGMTVRRPATPELIEKNLPEYIFQNWLELQNKIEGLKSICSRISFIEFQNKTEILTSTLIHKVSLQISYGAQQLHEVFDRNWAYFISQELAPPELEALAATPEDIVVPSGSRIPIHYEDPSAPFLRVRLQELFGWLETPKIYKDVRLRIELLAPNFRPVQITSDLESFWQNTYPEIRREFKIKYPKHSWPEDPKTAKAEAKGRPHRR